MNYLPKSLPFENFSSSQFNSRNRYKKITAIDVTHALGNVPIVRLKNISRVCLESECLLKLESCNPGGSIKEKNAVYLVKRAEEEGLLLPGGTIIESSSGNFGVGLAMVGAVRGYRVIIVVDAKTAPPFRRMLKAYGAELVDVPLHEADESGSMQKARMKRAHDLAATIPNAWYPCQHLNPWNTEAHSYYTAREIEAHFAGELDAVVVGVSTAGQIMGIARYLLPRFPKIRIVGVDVVGSVIMGTPAKPYKMTGIGLSFFPPNLDLSMLDRAYVIPEDMAYSVCHALASREGLLLGASTGAIVAGGLHLARSLGAGARILMINPDRGDRYLETVYDSDWLDHHGFTLKQGEHLDDAIASLTPLSF
ncbi:cysteine synthase family protein [Anabaena cylindrica FACHB-243]|uniref:Cysteine synthase n=1 Tax=Anabaena cylindrica (strain ATCC 27899 / PCC 7122) TaxID=272123 RepID=K9ZPD0_ANACC|nr:MULTISPECIES: cysteine synthase family protein [Anabaena]AFZ61093.1 Cysteine synthase [Anabaena cylindrica PCC 7122]MBD2421566.1 cysteine synthase family protein [Anabaena cylindrica FACHB-243]MBY5280535.1 cysteine synthase family protein [Anabaena sp. CCAP 1446/1C]MBY5308124.1 cysteine synthase family protein [Anabaena sp. CCAP 1446/1C]MCM2405535.1 cysteine synthase family protein [Anabaena sp. CCAP 1446/1C]